MKRNRYIQIIFCNNFVYIMQNEMNYKNKIIINICRYFIDLIVIKLFMFFNNINIYFFYGLQNYEVIVQDKDYMIKCEYYVIR